MQLSPLAREKLARIGEPTGEEKIRLKYIGQLECLLADFFTHKLNPDDLWKELKKYRDEGQSSIISEFQLKLLDTLSLSLGEADFAKRRDAILAAETLKDSADYLQLEADLKSIENLRRQYREEMEKTYQALQSRVEQAKPDSEQASRKLVDLGLAVDVGIEGVGDSSIRATSEWKSFIAGHDNLYNQKLKKCLDSLREKLQGRV